jgi:hypothetical protein
MLVPLLCYSGVMNAFNLLIDDDVFYFVAFRLRSSSAGYKKFIHILQIIQYVSLAYQEYDQAKINDIWLSLMGVLNSIIECHGGNDFKLPHLAEERHTA